jgi:hypothetical protein
MMLSAELWRVTMEVTSAEAVAEVWEDSLKMCKILRQFFVFVNLARSLASYLCADIGMYLQDYQLCDVPMYSDLESI